MTRRAALAIALLVSAPVGSCTGRVDRHRDPALSSQAPLASSGHEEPPEASRPATAVAPTTETVPATTDEEHVLRGRVSYYADSLAGHRTANGERYDPAELTCASRDLPFGTRLRVTREDTGASVVVRVNDRGPFGRRTRILDLSRRAAEELSMIRAGVIEVRVEILDGEAE